MSQAIQEQRAAALLPQSGRGYRPEIDGMRALAVIPVVLFHAGLGCPGGFVGVDVFFVISGYLITSIILREMTEGKFTFMSFWDRRVRRIFPAMAVCLLATLGFGALWLLPMDAANLGLSGLAQLALGSNIFFWRNTNYFGGDIYEKPLLHTWSLSVEEQFYLFLPVLLWLLFKWAKNSTIGPTVKARILVVATLFLGSLALSIWAVGRQPYAAFYLLPTRAWELLGGSLLAVLPPALKHSRFSSELLSLAGLAGILVPVFIYSENTPFPGVAALAPCLGTMALLWSNSQSLTGKLTLVGGVLAVKPLRWIGWISYSLYLWHWPVMVYAKYWRLEEASISERWGMVALSILLAYLSFKFVETPVRTRKRWPERKVLWRNSLILAGLIAILGIALERQWLVTEGRVASVESIRLIEEEKSNFFQGSLKRWLTRTSQEDIEDNQPGLFGVSDDGPIDVLILGDSHAYQLIQVADELAKESGLCGTLISHEATPPLLGWDNPFNNGHGVQDQEAWMKSVFDYLERHQIRVVLLHAFWSLYQRDGEGFRACFLETMKTFQDRGVQLYVLMDLPSYPEGLVRIFHRDKFFGGRWKVEGMRVPPEEHHQRNAQLHGLRVLLPSVKFIDPSEKLLDPQKNLYRLANEGHLLYFDDNHLNQRGVALVWMDPLQQLFQEIAELRNGKR